MARCGFCFKEKSGLQPPIPRFPEQVCKGCFYEIDKVVGFLQRYGFTIQGQMALPEKKTRKKRSTQKPPDAL